MWDFKKYKDIEFMAPEKIRSIQNRLLRRHIRYCGAHSPYYRRLFKKHGVDSREITLGQLSQIPTTGKDHLASENEDFVTVAPGKLVDIVFSSGTTGQPTKIAYTEHDLRRLAYNEHQSFHSAGVGRNDSVLLTCTMDRCFVAGLAYFLGTRSLGAAAIRNGHGTMQSHMEIIRRVSPTVMVGVPSFLLKLGEHMKISGMDPAFSPVRRIICIGEPVRGRDMRPLPVGRKLKGLWDASIFSTYASTETVSSFCECIQESGGHLHPELAVVEILDADGRAQEPGSTGELVVTPLGVEGMPLIRFRTGDISFIIEDTCPCGRNSLRIGPVLARKDQMIKLKGTTLYPQAIAQALGAIPEVTEHFLEVDSAGDLSDSVTVHVAVSDPQWDAQRIAQHLQSRVRVKPQVVVEPLDQIRNHIFSPRYRKPVRFVDRRIHEQ